MAIVKAPALSLDASGNVGAINYTRYKGYNIARAVGTYTDPNTPAQQAARAHATTASQAWGGTLTEAERETWNDRAKSVIFINRLGDPYQPSGYQVFLKWNMQRLHDGIPINEAAPPGNFTTEIEKLESVTTGFPGEMETKLLKAGAAQIDAASVVVFRAGPYNSGGRRAIWPEFRKVSVQTPPANYLNVGLTATKYYWWRAFGVFNSGQRTNSFEVQAIVPI